MPSVSPLAAFSHDWIGGDFRGLQGIAEQLYAYLPRVQDLVGALSVTARGLVADGPDGWQGAAAGAFTTAWGKQVRTAAALEDYVIGVAQSIDSLAVELSQIENALETEAYNVSKHGVQIGADGTVQGESGARGLEWAIAYNKLLEQARNDAEQARDAATAQLYSLYQQVMKPNPHLNGADANTASGLLADLLATPTAARREVSAKMKGLQGKGLSLEEKIAKAERTGESIQELTGESTKVETELQQVQEELAKTGKSESLLSRLLDTRASNVEGYLAGQAGSGRHVAGNTPEDLRAAADDGEPGALDTILKAGNDIPVVDVLTTLAGTGVGTYYDVKGGQPLGSALRDEAISNTAGTVAATSAGYLVGAEWGAQLGAAAGPVGIVAGAVIGYGVGDIAHNLLVENWSQDIHDHGVVHGLMDGVGHSMDASADDTRELAVGAGHEAEHLWDSAF